MAVWMQSKSFACPYLCLVFVLLELMLNQLSWTHIYLCCVHVGSLALLPGRVGATWGTCVTFSQSMTPSSRPVPSSTSSPRWWSAPRRPNKVKRALVIIQKRQLFCGHVDRCHQNKNQHFLLAQVTSILLRHIDYKKRIRAWPLLNVHSVKGHSFELSFVVPLCHLHTSSNRGSPIISA